MQRMIDRRQVLSAMAGTIGVGLFPSTTSAAVRNRWAAIAQSNSGRRINWVWGYASRADASRAALDAHGARDAKIAISGSGSWLAIATGPRSGWGAASGKTLHEAKNAAHDTCKHFTKNRGEISACVYGGDHGVDFSIDLDPAFPKEERKLLVGALQQMRFLLGNVVGRLDKIARDYWILDDVVQKYFIDPYEPSPSRKRDLMGTQAFYMDFYSHPKLRVTAYHEKSNYWAKAPVGRVILPYGTKGTSDMKGSFEIKVNRYHLGARGNGSDRRVWAGVLAHELMHNLGHMHGQNEYGDHLQINAVQQLVRTWGEYKKNAPCPAFACDCRRLWR